MGLFDQFPYTNFHELNLMWILEALKEIQTTTEQFVAINSLKYADPIQWNIVKQYEKNTIVIDPLTGTAYISVQPVPTGVQLYNTDYWTKVFDLGAFVVRAAKNFTTRYEEETTTAATFNSVAGDWLVWGDTLYRANTNITAGDSYVEGGNIQRITVEEVKNAIYTIIGDLADLDTEDKSNLVAAINEIAGEVLGKIGDLADLDTEDKSNLVAAINEVAGEALGKIGDLADLDTEDKSNLVAAINEVAGDTQTLAKLEDVALIYETMLDAISDAANLVNGYIIKTRGYYAVNDGGAGLYIITNTTSNDAFYISLGSGLYAALIDAYTDVNAKKCGLKENTSTQAEADANSDIINNIIDIIYTLHPSVELTNGYYRGGGAVHIPQGAYYFNKAFTSADGKMGLTIYGDGKYHTKLNVYDASNNFSLIKNTLDFAHIMGLCVHGLMICNFTNAIEVIHAANVEIYDCIFQGNTVAIRMDTIVDVLIHDNIFIGGAGGTRLTSSLNNSTTLYIYNNWFTNQNDSSIILNNYNTGHGFRTVYIEDNVIEYSPNGIYASGDDIYSRFYASNNHIEQCTTAINSIKAAFKLKDNDIDTGIIITNPQASQLYDLDDFWGAVSLSGGLNDPNLKLIWNSRTGRKDDTISMIFRRLVSSIDLTAFPNNGSGNSAKYKITYKSSNGMYSAIGTWVRGSSGWAPDAATVVSSGVSAPSTNAGGTVAFNDNGGNPNMTIEFMGYNS